MDPMGYIGIKLKKKKRLQYMSKPFQPQGYFLTLPKEVNRIATDGCFRGRKLGWIKGDRIGGL